MVALIPLSYIISYSVWKVYMVAIFKILDEYDFQSELGVESETKRS